MAIGLYGVWRKVQRWLQKYQGWVKLLIGLTCTWFIYRQVSKYQDSSGVLWEMLDHALRPEQILLFLALLFLMPINYLIHAQSWQDSIRSVEQISLFEAFKGVMTSVAITFTVPSMVGTMLGRVWHMKSANRYRALGATGILSACQHYVYILMGGSILLWYGSSHGLVEMSQWWIIAYATCTAMTIFLIRPLMRLVRLLKFSTKLYDAVSIMESYQLSHLIWFSLLSSMRLLVILLQFWLAFLVLGVDVPLSKVFAGTTLLLTGKVIIPSFGTFVDLGTREALAIWVFEQMDVSAVISLGVTTLIWLINQAGAGIIGLWYMRRAQVVREDFEYPSS